MYYFFDILEVNVDLKQENDFEKLQLNVLINHAVPNFVSAPQ